MEAKVYNQEGKEVEAVELPSDIFGLPWNPDLVHQVAVAHQANKRAVIAHTKTRAEVSGSGKKPWRQKGTGRARHGSIRSPLWKGGGVTHGPRKDKDYSQKINKKMNRKAILTVLSRKLKENEVVVLDELKLAEPKTKLMNNVLKNLPIGKPNALIGLPKNESEIIRASKNLPKIKVAPAGNFNVLDLLSYKYVILPKNSIEVLEKTFGSKGQNSKIKVKSKKQS